MFVVILKNHMTLSSRILTILNFYITGSACSTLASILHTQGRHEEALDLLKRVLSIQEDLGADDPEIGFTLELIVVMLDALDRKSEIPEILLKMEKLTKDLGSRYGIN